MMSPVSSWVAKWQRIDRYKKGIYAIQVTGRLPDEVVMLLEDKGISYRPRDGSSIVM
jgi:transcription elongation factor SPT4